MAVIVNIYAVKTLEDMRCGGLSDRRKKYYEAMTEKYGDTYTSSKLGDMWLPSDSEVLE